MKDRLFEIVGNDEWAEAYRSHWGKYEDVAQAIQFLMASPIGTKVKIKAGGNPMRKRAAIYRQAHYREMSLRMHLAGGYFYMRSNSKVLGVKSTKGDVPKLHGSAAPAEHRSLISSVDTPKSVGQSN